MNFAGAFRLDGSNPALPAATPAGDANRAPQRAGRKNKKAELDAALSARLASVGAQRERFRRAAPPGAPVPGDDL
jgi:hypothetical protein